GAARCGEDRTLEKTSTTRSIHRRPWLKLERSLHYSKTKRRSIHLDASNNSYPARRQFLRSTAVLSMTVASAKGILAAPARAACRGIAFKNTFPSAPRNSGAKTEGVLHQ